MTVDVEDPAAKALDSNPGWRLLATGKGRYGQTTLTYGWPWQEPETRVEPPHRVERSGAFWKVRLRGQYTTYVAAFTGNGAERYAREHADRLNRESD